MQGAESRAIFHAGSGPRHKHGWAFALCPTPSRRDPGKTAPKEEPRAGLPQAASLPKEASGCSGPGGPAVYARPRGGAEGSAKALPDPPSPAPALASKFTCSRGALLPGPGLGAVLFRPSGGLSAAPREVPTLAGGSGGAGGHGSGSQLPGRAGPMRGGGGPGAGPV